MTISVSKKMYKVVLEGEQLPNQIHNFLFLFFDMLKMNKCHCLIMDV